MGNHWHAEINLWYKKAARPGYLLCLALGLFGALNVVIGAFYDAAVVAYGITLIVAAVITAITKNAIVALLTWFVIPILALVIVGSATSGPLFEDAVENPLVLPYLAAHIAGFMVSTNLEDIKVKKARLLRETIERRRAERAALG